MQLVHLKRIALAALLILLPITLAYAHDQKLAVFVDNSYPPYMYELDEGRAEGLYPRLIAEITQAMDHEVEILATPWKRALLYGNKGLGAVGGAYKNNERLEQYDYSAPLYQEKMVLFVNKEKPFEFNRIQDLAGKVIGVNRGWSYGQEFDAARKTKLFEVNIRNNPSENFKMLALGRIDCLILDQLSGDSYIRLLGMSDKIISLPIHFSMNDGFLIISKELKMKKFLDDFNSNLEKIRQNGTYERIIRKFIQGTMPNIDTID